MPPEWTFGVFEVRARERVSLERGYVRVCRQEWTFGDFEIRVRARVSRLGSLRRGAERSRHPRRRRVIRRRSRARVSTKRRRDLHARVPAVMGSAQRRLPRRALRNRSKLDSSRLNRPTANRRRPTPPRARALLTSDYDHYTFSRIAALRVRFSRFAFSPPARASPASHPASRPAPRPPSSHADGRSAFATAAALGTARVAFPSLENDSTSSRGTIAGSAIPSPPIAHDHITTGSRCIAR